MEFYVNCVEHNAKILVTGYKDGKRFMDSVRYEPYLFVRSKTETQYKTIDGTPVQRRDFANIYDAKKYIRDYKDVEGFEIYGFDKFNYVYLKDKYGDIKPDTSLIKTCVLDIECDTEGGFPDLEIADKEITAITMLYKDITFVLGYVDYVPEDSKVKYVKCTNEHDLLTKFLKIWTSDAFRPDVVTGWNIELFDIPYIVRRISLVLGEDEAKKISPWGILNKREFESFGKINVVFMPLGINILDYMSLYKKFTYTQQESYRLDHIAFVELGEKKIDYSEYGTLNKLYKQNPQLFITYNIHDCTLIQRLDDKMGLLNLVYEFAYDSGTNFEDAMRPVRSWDVIIHNDLMTYKRVVPQYDNNSNEQGFPVGAHVKAPLEGMHDWVVSFDLASLYPHLIIGYNISPETYRGKIKDYFSVDALLDGASSKVADYLKENNLALAANGCLYTKDFQGFLPRLMQELFDKRKLYKKKMLESQKEYETSPTDELKNLIAKYNNLQMAIKIKLNSAYGALLNPGFRYYSKDFAESITIGGQLTIRWAEKKMNEFVNKIMKTTNVDYVIASDTDSLYINFGPLVKHLGDKGIQKNIVLLDEFCERKIQPYLNKIYQELAEMMNAYKQAMQMKREGISERGIFIAKKRYALNVWNNEGVQYTEPKLKMMGIEAVRSSTPLICRDALKEALKIMLTKTEKDLVEYINEFKKQFEKTEFEKIAFPRTANGMNDYRDPGGIYRSKTPIHVRGSLLYNHHCRLKGIDKDVDLILNRDKIKFCYLKEPNPIRENIIAAPSSLPKELNLDAYIDYDTQFDKAFLDPLKGIMKVIGWEFERKATLDKFFS